MEFCWFAICTILAFTPWISAEERMLYQTPNENRWGGWVPTSNGRASLNVIKLVFQFCCFTYPEYEHPICQRVAFLWCPGCVLVDPTSLSKDTYVRRAHFSQKYNGLLSDIFCRMPVLFYTHFFCSSNLHVLSTILLLFISQR